MSTQTTRTGRYTFGKHSFAVRIEAERNGWVYITFLEGCDKGTTVKVSPSWVEEDEPVVETVTIDTRPVAACDLVEGDVIVVRSRTSNDIRVTTVVRTEKTPDYPEDLTRVIAGKGGTVSMTVAVDYAFDVLAAYGSN